jgi:hypothetical protein
MLKDEARCANEDCSSKDKCARFSDDGTATYAHFGIGIDGKCDGYLRKVKPRCVILKSRGSRRLKRAPRI